MNSPQQQQMATPINNLPLKTAPPQDQSEIEDPLIQNVLKEFEDDIRQQKEPQYQEPVQFQQPQYQQPTQIPQQQYQQIQPQQMQPYQHPKTHKKLIDKKVLKSTVIITIIVFILQSYNFINILIPKLPEIVSKHISGKEFLLNFLLIFAIFYALTYFEFI